MKDHKCDWTNAHAQLWTSFKRAQKENLSNQSIGKSGIGIETNANLVQAPELIFGHDVFLSILDELTITAHSDKPVLSAELERRIIELIEDCRTEPSVRMLLTAIIHMKKHITKVNAESVCMQESLASVVSESMFHLNGESEEFFASVAAVDTSTDTTTKNVDEEKYFGYTEALANIESRFFAVLIQIEECKKTIRTLAEKKCPYGTVSNESSIKEMLNILTYEEVNAVKPKDLEQDDKSILTQVMDILEAPEGSEMNCVPDLVLNVVKELESLRRENQSNSMLLMQYECTVMNKLASYGITSFPTVEQERDVLLSKDNNVCPSFDDKWIREDLAALLSAMVEIDTRHHLDKVPNWLQKGPVDTSAGAMLEYLRILINTARNLLVILGSDVMNSKICVNDILRKLTGGEQSSDELRATSVGEGLLADAISKVRNIIEDQGTREQLFLEMSLGKHCDKTLDELMKIARWLPDNDLKQIIELGKNKGAIIDYMENALRRFVEASNSQDYVLLQVEKLGSQIDKLMNNDYLKGVHNVFDEASISSLMNTAEELRLWAKERNEAYVRTENAMIQQSLYELAQLLPNGVSNNILTSDARIDPPVSNLLDMVQLLKRRLEELNKEQQKQKLSGAQSRFEKARMEEVVRERSKQIVRITKEILVGAGNLAEMEEVLGKISSTILEEPTCASVGGSGGKGTGSNGVCFVRSIFDDLEERLKLVKTRYHRLSQSYSANKVRLENLAQSNISHSKRWSRICSTLAVICRAVGLDNVANRLEQDFKVDTASPTSKGVLRPDQRKANILQPVTDADLFEVLKLVEGCLKSDENLGDRARQISTLRRLQEEEKRWCEEMDTFRKAMQMILLRLAETGRRIKRSLFMLGTDESAEDEVVESVICDQQRAQQNCEKNEEMVVEACCTGEKQDMCEQSLAILLQKFGRWATRLQETTEDHLYTQQRLTKYFAALHRFFCGDSDNAVASRNMNDSNLIDTDTMLMQLADDILPVVDRAVMTAKTFEENDRSNDHRSNRTKQEEGDDARCKALCLLLQDVSPAHIVSMDHRLVRLYESIGRLRTVVDGLLSVRYLSIPKESHRRGGDTTNECIFDDVWGNSYVELDLGKLGGTTISAATTDTDAESKDVPAFSEGELFRAVENNIRTVYQALCKFSTNYKLAVILVQKDTDLIQEFIAAMLEPYMELDVNQAFQQDPLVLNEMLLLLKERGTLQRGCYFFNRIGGEGPSLWTTALEQLSVGFIGILEVLRKRTLAAAELRELFNDVVDFCVMYVNWVNTSADVISPLIPFSKEVLGACVREDEKREGAPDVRQQEQDKKKALKPPLPSNNNLGSVVYFNKDDVVLKVLAHMFQFIQEVVNSKRDVNGSHTNSNYVENGDSCNRGAEKMEEQLQLLREAVTAAEHRANVALEDCKCMEHGRDRALSEAAISRAELRRWKRLYGIAEDQTPPPPLSLKQEVQQRQGTQIGQSSVKETGATMTTVEKNVPGSLTDVASLPASCDARDILLLQVAHSVNELTEQLRDACKQCTVSSCQTATRLSSPVKSLHRRSPSGTGSKLGSNSKSQSREDAQLRSSGIVQSPKKEENIFTRQKSLSPRSSSSSSFFLSNARKGQLSSCKNEDFLRKLCSRNHHHHKIQKQHQQLEEQKELSVKQKTKLVPSASVVVSPVGETYSSLARVYPRAASGKLSASSANRYKPSRHSSVFFNDCDVCCRHHDLSHVAKRTGVAVSPSSSRLCSPKNKAMPSSLLSTSQKRGTTPQSLRHGKMETNALRDTHSNPPSSGYQQVRVRAPSREMSLLDLGREGLRKSSSMVRGHSLASVSSGARDLSGREERNQYRCYLQQSEDEQDRRSLSNSLSYLRGPSTSTVLSRNSGLGSTDIGVRKYQKGQFHSEQDKYTPRRQGQHKGATLRHLNGVQQEETAPCETSIGVIGRKAASGTSSKSLRSSMQNKTTRHRSEQQQQHGATASTRLVGKPENRDQRSEAITRLTDVVARTKIAGREEI